MRILSALLISLQIFVATDVAVGQEFRIVTTIRNLAAEKPASSGVTTLTLLRQSKVYDYIESLGEVIIYQPGAKQFTILNVRRSLATTVHFDEVRRLLGSRRPEVELYVASLRSNSDPIAEDVAAAFEFQLHPRFEEAFDPAKNVLTLSSPKCTYKVTCDSTREGRGQQVAQYLTYADWMAKLNSVLHPGAMFPEPRIELNKSLRRHGRLPVRVELKTSLDGNLHLAAEHKIAFKLEDRDRSRITEWESLLDSPRVTKTTFPVYQRKMLTASR